MLPVCRFTIGIDSIEFYLFRNFFKGVTGKMKMSKKSILVLVNTYKYHVLQRASEALHWVGIGGSVACIFDSSTSIELIYWPMLFFIISWSATAQRSDK